MEEDLNKISKKVKELKSGKSGRGKWIFLDGIFSIPFTPTTISGGVIVGVPSKKGILLKAFYNQNTGEIKFYTAEIFKKTTKKL